MEKPVSRTLSENRIKIVTLPVSAVIPTKDRRTSLERMLGSLAEQSAQPREVIVVDASTDQETKILCENSFSGLESRILYSHASKVGAASQRNEAMPYVSREAVWFVDDDVIFEPDCLQKLWSALQNDPRLGGVNAMIINQQYKAPGLASRLLFQFLNGRPERSYAGKCIGPALNILPEDRPDLPEVVPVEWLNTTCTLYRCEALPEPVFSDHFQGYSMMEDVALSLIVGRNWKLANVRTARIFHNSQAGNHKANPEELSEMELVNRHYVMTQILGRQKISDYLKLAVLCLFNFICLSASFKRWPNLPAIGKGMAKGISKIRGKIISKN